MIENLLVNGRVFNWAHDLDAAFQVPRHPIGGGNVDLGVRVGQLPTGAETNDARMFEEPTDDRFDADVLRHAGHTGPEAADAAHDEFDFHALVRGAIERVDDLGMHQRVQLSPDRAFAAGANVRDLLVDQLQQGLLRINWRHRDLFQIRWPRITRDKVEELAGVAAQCWIAGKEREVGVNLRGLRVIIAGAKMGVGAQALRLAAHDEADLGVRLEVDEAVHHGSAGALQRLGDFEVRLFVEARLELDDGGDVLAGFGGGDERGDDRRILRGAIERLLDSDDGWIGRGLADELHHRVERLERVMHQHVLGADSGETIAAEILDALGKTRRIAREFKIRPLFLDQRRERG